MPKREDTYLIITKIKNQQKVHTADLLTEDDVIIHLNVHHHKVEQNDHTRIFSPFQGA